MNSGPSGLVPPSSAASCSLPGGLPTPLGAACVPSAADPGEAAPAGCCSVHLPPALSAAPTCTASAAAAAASAAAAGVPGRAVLQYSDGAADPSSPAAASVMQPPSPVTHSSAPSCGSGCSKRTLHTGMPDAERRVAPSCKARAAAGSACPVDGGLLWGPAACFDPKLVPCPAVPHLPCS